MGWNGKFTVEYEMLNKDRVINEIFSEKAKKRSSTFLESCEGKILGKFND